MATGAVGSAVDCAEVATECLEVSDSGLSPMEDHELAMEGITLLLNNDWAAAQDLFDKHKDYSPLMCGGSSMVMFMQALMTFEDEKLGEAMTSLRETEKRCESNSGFIKTVKRKFRKEKKEKQVKMEDRLQSQVVLADSILHQAILTFINQDIPSYVKGGWLLRRAWKSYDKTYKEIKNLVARSHCSVSSNGSPSGLKKSPSVNGSSGLKKSTSKDSDISDIGLPAETAERLLGSVSFGFGAFQLCISMVPPKLLKIIEFLGFEGDRDLGLDCLHVASESKDMKAPLATLGLLWYHTVIRPFFALDGGNIDAGVDDATVILEESEKTYPKSALFLFFKGRVQRLKCDLDTCLVTYSQALEMCEDQREIQLICLHEIGWANLMLLRWQEALSCFARLKEESRWSKSYYGYLTAMCQGAAGDIKGAESNFTDVLALIKRKNNQIEAFVARRAEKFKKVPVTQEHCKLLGMEILYLWNALPTCPKTAIKEMLDECGALDDKHLFHLRSLIEGALYREMGEREMSIQCFEEAVARHQGMKEDQHVAAFAMYEQGIMLSEKPQTFLKGQICLTTVKDNMKDYDFENRLHVRIYAALHRAKTEGTPL